MGDNIFLYFCNFEGNKSEFEGNNEGNEGNPDGNLISFSNLCMLCIIGLLHLYDWSATLCNKSYTSFVTKKTGPSSCLVALLTR